MKKTVKRTTRTVEKKKTPMSVKLAKTLINHPLNKVIDDSLKEFGTYVVEERAVPSYQDGLKPSQRRVLWAMYYAKGNRPEKGRIKSADAEGATMAYHPHSGAYPTIVNMIEGTPSPLMVGYGNFGSFSKLLTPAAASRYTEVKLSHFTMEMFFDKRFEKVYPTVPSYTGLSKEPVWLPTQLPMILALGQSGIAVGVNTDIPSFTVESLYRVAKALFKTNKKPTAKLLANNLEFSSAYGGKLLSDKKTIENLMATGVGVIDWICDFEIRGKDLHIIGLPPGWSYDKKVENIRDIPEVASVADITSEKGIDIRVTFKRLSDDDWHDAVAKVKKHLTSRKHHKCNITKRQRVDDELVATTSSEFESVSIVKLFQYWMDFRLSIEKKALKIEFEELKEQLEHQQLMKLACLNLDIIFQILKMKKVDKVKTLSTRLKITEEQAKTIWSIPVGRLDNLSEQEIDDKIKNLKAQSLHVRKMFKQPSVSVVQQMLNNKNLTKPEGVVS